MSSLYIVGCGKEKMHTFITLLQNEIKNFIKQNNASFFNLKTLWKAEVSSELLKKNARLVLPFADSDQEYWGFFHVNDYDSLYSLLFSSMQNPKSSYSNQENYTTSHLKSLLKQVDTPFKRNGSLPPYDFRIIYHSELISDSERICTLKVDIKDLCLDALDFLQHVVYELDTFSPDVFFSACIDDSYTCNFNFKFDHEMLTKRVVNMGKAFYVSNNLAAMDISTNDTILQQYVLSPMSNGIWFTQRKFRMKPNYNTIKLNDILIPQYMVVNWCDLSSDMYLRATDFDTISIYYDKFSPMDPTLIFSRGYSSLQLDCLSKELGDLVLKEQYPADVLLDNR